MCGIVAYIGPKEAYPIILKGLKRLEYRGYDSSGVALMDVSLKVYKKKGRVSELEESLIGQDLHAPCRDRSYALGYPRRTQRPECAPAQFGQRASRYDSQRYY